MPDEGLEEIAHRLRAELIEIAVDQISAPIAHEFDIRIALDRTDDGGDTVTVEASSRSVQPVRITVRVDVRPAGAGLVIERDPGRQPGGLQRIDVDVADASPQISDALHRRMNDFVARCIASAVSQLNAEMQRHLGWHGWHG